MKIFLSGVFCLVYFYNNFIDGYILDTDQPCLAQEIPGQSIICVCNAAYCDTITRTEPEYGTYVAYTSSESGLRFRKTVGYMFPSYQGPPTYATTLELDPTTLYQVITGFGGAVTDSAAINWQSLKDPRLKKYFVNSYFSKWGLEYNMIRLPMGGADFSTRPYTYDDFPDDYDLSRFKLAPEDIEFKIPLIKECMSVATSTINILATMWSPPAWMKSTNSITSGYLKDEYYQTLADYFLKFLKQYKEFDVPIWGVTTTNEPLSTQMFNIGINRLEWTAPNLGHWISNNLGPTLRNSMFKNVKIVGVDDQRFTIPLWVNILEFYHPKALEYVDGIGVHFYYDTITPPSQLTLMQQSYPDKFILGTEACNGASAALDEKVILGSWSRGEVYAGDIIQDLNYNMVGWIDWNICLDKNGGPNWINNFVDSPIIVSADKQEFYKQPMFYVMGHFSKFIPRGSRRIKVTETTNILEILNVEHVAFLTPQNTIVVILFNRFMRRDVIIKLGSQMTKIDLEPKSITTVEFPYKGTYSW